MEKDWKLFKKIAPELRERYLKKKNEQIKRIFDDQDKNETERFWEAWEQIEKECKILSDCLDGHSRSKMIMHMMLMSKYGMMDERDLDGFSEDVRIKIKRYKELH